MPKKMSKKKIIGLGILAILAISVWQFTIMVMPFVGIWYTWKKSKYSQNKKIVITLALVGIILFGVFAMQEGAKQAEIDKTISLEITEPADNTTTTAKAIVIKGVVNLEGAKLKINNEKVSLDGTSFSHNANLQEEQANTFEIVVKKGSYDIKKTLTITNILSPEEKAEREKVKAQQEAELKAQKEKEEQIKADLEKKLKLALSNMRVEKDEFNNTASYRDKTSPQYVSQNGFFLTIKENPTLGRYFTLQVQYSGGDWLFINRYIVKADDQTFTLIPEDVHRDNTNYVWEWSSFYNEDDFMPMVKAVIDAKDVKIRYQGNEYYKDRVITATEKQALQNVLDAMVALKMGVQ